MILYFSATGNCKYVAERIALALGDKPASIEKQEPVITLGQNEVFGFVTPTYLYQLPPIVRKYIGKVTLKNTGYSFSVSTYGTSPGFTGEDIRKELKKRGVQLSASFSVKMPDTWTPTYDLSDPEKVAGQNEAAEAQIDSVIQRIRRRETGNQTDHRLPYFIRPITVPLLNSERKTKHFYVEDSCIGCGLCARRCPVQAIEMQENRPVWVKEQCTLCLRCLHHCPKFAIQYGNGKTKKHGQYRNPHTKV